MSFTFELECSCMNKTNFFSLFLPPSSLSPSPSPPPPPPSLPPALLPPSPWGLSVSAFPWSCSRPTVVVFVRGFVLEMMCQVLELWCCCREENRNSSTALTQILSLDRYMHMYCSSADVMHVHVHVHVYVEKYQMSV